MNSRNREYEDEERKYEAEEKRVSPSSSEDEREEEIVQR